MPEKTLAEISLEVSHAVAGLERLIKIQRDAARRRFWTVVLVVIPLAMVISTVVTIGTVSTCFLGGPRHPGVCAVMPGYSDTVHENDKIIKQFKNLLKVTSRNDHRIDVLERQANSGG